MKDINVGHIKQVSDLRPAEKSPRKEQPTGSGDFQKALESAAAQIDQAKNRASDSTREVTPSTIREEASKLDEAQREMMIARQNLSQLYQSMKSQKTEDKG